MPFGQELALEVVQGRKSSGAPAPGEFTGLRYLLEKLRRVSENPKGLRDLPLTPSRVRMNPRWYALSSWARLNSPCRRWKR
jgi:hypothetical protein